MTERVQAADLAALLVTLNGYSGLNIWVIGDLMLDEYIMGAVDRISPEAPVPVVRVGATEHRLGGAANVARQAAALGAHVTLVGVIGVDAAGDDLLRLCNDAGINTHAIARRADRRTTRKLRVLSHSQQLLRLDWEDAQPCPDAAAAEMMRELARGAAPDAVILSDYAKGVLTPGFIATVMQSRAGAPVIVDPKNRDFTRYRGATTVTPNLRELELAAQQTLDPANIAAIAAAARLLMAGADLEAMVVTMSERGMLVVPAQGPEVAIPATKLDVFDVTGAGDTAVAVLGLSLAAGAPLLGAAQIANAAAGVSVGHVGAVAVDRDSIRNALCLAAGWQGPQPRGSGCPGNVLAPVRQAHRLHQRLLRPAACRPSVAAERCRKTGRCAGAGDQQ